MHTCTAVVEGRLTRKPNELTVKDIKNSFPHRKRSNYLYRFKVRTEGEGYLWLDLEDNEPVPLCASQTIFMKLNRTTSYRKEQVPQETPPLPNRKRSINLV